MMAMQQRRSTRSILGSVAAVAVTALVGCADGDKKGSGEDAEPVGLEIEATAEGQRKVMTFTSSIAPGLVTMTLTNSDTVPRSVQLLRIVGNHPIADVVEVITGDGEEIPDWIQDGGGVAAVEPGASATASQVLAPGRYVLLDDETGAGDNAKSYAELGAAGEFTITGERSKKARLGARRATITAEDATDGRKQTYGFRLEGLKAGTNQVHFQNTGAQLHHARFVPLREGATIGQAKTFLQSDSAPSGAPPVDFAGIVGTKVIDAGIEQNLTLDLVAGRYAVVCFISDRTGGEPHVAKGMIEELTVE